MFDLDATDSGRGDGAFEIDVALDNGSCGLVTDALAGTSPAKGLRQSQYQS